MTDDLVKRLREYRVGCGLHCEAHDAQEPLSECIEAADRLKKLESALREINDLYEGEEIADGVYARHRAYEMNEMIYKIVCDTLEGKND